MTPPRCLCGAPLPAEDHPVRRLWDALELMTCPRCPPGQVFGVDGDRVVVQIINVGSA